MSVVFKGFCEEDLHPDSVVTYGSTDDMLLFDQFEDYYDDTEAFYAAVFLSNTICVQRVIVNALQLRFGAYSQIGMNVYWNGGRWGD